ncbi:MAG: FHA domain-containing protein [Polaromonas sp.]|nr:FHA domain-containing protein [Polaromonas sp.]
MPQLITTVEGVEIMRLDLKKPRTTLGRKRHNDIFLDNRVVSGEHCVFELDESCEVYVEDLGSTNGTHLNGRLMHSRERMRDKDAISIGNFQVQYVAGLEAKPRVSRDDTKTLPLNSMGFPSTSSVRQAALRVLNGTSVGLDVPITKTVTTFGQPGTAVMSISHRRDGYYAGCMGDCVPVLMNGVPLGNETRQLAHGDVLDLSGTQMEFRSAGL